MERQRQGRGDRGARGTRADIKGPAQFSDAFAHSSNAHATLQMPGAWIFDYGETATGVADLKRDTIWIRGDSDCRGLAARMAVNVSQALLQDAKHG